MKLGHVHAALREPEIGGGAGGLATNWTTTPKGTPICQFSLAINRQFKMESGETREEVIYVDVEAWGKQGETIAKYVVGRSIHAECQRTDRRRGSVPQRWWWEQRMCLDDV